jgi:hypothetical protein
MRQFIKLAAVLLAVVALATSCSTARKAANRDTLTWQYEIEPAIGQASQGAILVKVWSYSRNKDVAMEQAAKNAVHGVLFKGVAALSNRYQPQRPIVTDLNAEQSHSGYFKSFFADRGKYMKYVNFVNNGIPAPGDIIKVGKEYKVGVSVSVAKDALRKEMEAAGIVKALGAGF